MPTPEQIVEKALRKVFPTKVEEERILRIAENYRAALEEEVRRRRLKDVDVILAGSVAKRTFSKNTRDIDIFIRFPDVEMMKAFESICRSALRNPKLIHGSRDFFRKVERGYLIEVVPALKISRPEEAENTIDLSYFHINYVRSKLNEKLRKDIILFKTFLQANNCYGAETYRHGFSGYACELLILHYGSFLNTLRELCRPPKIFIDMEGYYKNEEEVRRNLSEAKLRSPIILIDPTFKQRNVLASLTYKTFSTFQLQARKFLLHPSLNFFIKREVKLEELRRRSAKRGTKLFLLQLKKPLNDDVFVAKLERELKQFKSRALREGYRFYASGIEVDGKVIVFVEVETLDLSKRRIHLGPPVWVREIDFQKFIRKWGEVYVVNGRLATDVPRRKFQVLWKEFVKKIREMHHLYLK
ncbi:MAG: CCA tRNA nucleotidyltransferase [Candidatus Nanoarchaeia archaeon]|nr:CCA tRNA nucleotidyltransferase [Candidatus Haiyanarchaeum thermophilum]MCW1303423.1 CCA tRNA nucleotidyltransferase [Candidatus Haiyanarchaeum thermophilum]MCW1303890.1 CCA tRNA nucleotidyltransferase [Candidatus Haiyanarchaeum thermophilum]MCW1306875.1 CCA tRNA nucleotidyltransferase [Candidatus Haiyanarchaeum thermophilum]MCW1307449.1 CCA tRNA nucleotidyltransferase [Candidatus Haiyanarchaeum thermophilum]